MEDVVYRDVPGFPGYRVGDDGSVWSCWCKPVANRRSVMTSTWHPLKPNKLITRCGKGPIYYRVQLCRDRKVYGKQIHRMVLEAFVGDCPDGMECCHNDGNPTNNRLENLRWGTRCDNAADARRHGTIPRGSKRSRAVLTETTIPIIRGLVRRGMPKNAVAKIYGVNPKTIVNIMARKTWTHVPDDL